MKARSKMLQRRIYMFLVAIVGLWAGPLLIEYKRPLTEKESKDEDAKEIGKYFQSAFGSL